MEEIDEMIEERELKAGTQILEMVSSKIIQSDITDLQGKLLW